MLNTYRWILICVALAAQDALAQSSQGSGYPTKTVRVIVPWPPGGTVDILARAIAQKLTDRFGQSMIVDNRSGASGILGSEAAAKAPADGYTILIDSISVHATTAALYPKLSYNSLRDFTPVTMLATLANVIVVHPSVPARSLNELVRLAKAQPDQLNYASGGTGTPPHLAAELFKTAAGIRMVHVPYKGGPPALIDLIAGHVPVCFSPLATALAQIKAGKARALAVTGAKRSAFAPEVPTVAESGYPGYEANNWYGMLTPNGLARDIIAKLSAETHAVARLPDVAERLAAQGFEIVLSSPEQLREHMGAEFRKWEQVIKVAGVRIE